MDVPHQQQPTGPRSGLPSGPPSGPLEGRVVAPVGFTGPPVGAAHGQDPTLVQGPVWASLTPPPAAVAWPGAPVAPRRRRWLPAALAGAGVALLLGGGLGGYAVGQAVAGTGGATGAGTTGQVVPGDGTVPGGAGGAGGFGGPADGSGRQFGQQGQLGQGQLGQQGTDGTGTGTDGGTSGGTGSTTTT